MRSVRGRGQPRAASRRTSAWLVLAALLGLWLSQPLHPAAVARPTESGSAIGALMQGTPSSPHPAHDASACQLCRAATQTRGGLRSFVHSGALAPVGVPSRLECVSIALPHFGPVRSDWPRAPPSARFVLDS